MSTTFRPCHRLRTKPSTHRPLGSTQDLNSGDRLTPSPPWGYYLTYRVPHLKKREKEELKPELYTERCRNSPGISPAVKRKWDVAYKCSVFVVIHSLHASVCLYQREARCIYQSVTSDLFDSAGQREWRERCLVMSI